MSFGVGTDLNQAYVSAGNWEQGPMGGVELVEDTAERASAASWHGRISPDMWTIIIILGALGGLWFLGGVVLKNINVV